MHVQPSEAYPIMRTILTNALIIKDEILNVGLNTRADDFRAQVAAMFFLTQAQHAHSILAMEFHRDAALIARSMYEGDLKLRWLLSNPDSDFKARQWHAQGWRVDYENLHRRREMNRTCQVFSDAEESQFRTDEKEILQGIQHFQDLLLTEDGKAALLAGNRLHSRAFQPVFPSVEAMCNRLGFDSTYYNHYRSMSEYSHFGSSGLSQIWKIDAKLAKRSIIMEEKTWSCWCLSIGSFSFLGSMAATNSLVYGNRYEERIQELITQLGEIRRLI